MSEGGNFYGVAAKEIEEELGLQIKKEDMVYFTELAHKGKFKRMYPSNGASDEYLRLFLYRKKISEKELEARQGKK